MQFSFIDLVYLNKHTSLRTIIFVLLRSRKGVIMTDTYRKVATVNVFMKSVR